MDSGEVDNQVLRYSAFTAKSEGGNPAGVVLDARGLSDEQMLSIAAEVGYSETAFLCPRADSDGRRSYEVKYFSAEAQVSFCGHATVAAAIALADRQGPGDVIFDIGSGEVPVHTSAGLDGSLSATLTSVPPHVEDVLATDISEAAALLDWTPVELDPALPPKIAYAGARHLILAAATRERLARLDYDFDGLKAYMLDRDLTTLDLVWREDPLTFHARNPFPVGGVVEDPATGAAAAAFGAYLREIKAIEPPARVTILQGYDMGRPSELLVDLTLNQTEIKVSGRAVAIRS
jgi:PhzF family phenazine biosynthesis protein